jgi:hypothetical protein
MRIAPIYQRFFLRYNASEKAKGIPEQDMMKLRKASTVNFRFWFERQVRNARRPRALSESTDGRCYFEKLLGKSRSAARD